MANFLCLNFGGRKNFFRGVVGKENVTIWGGFTRRNQENRLKIYWNSYSSRTCRIWADNNQLIYISSYPARITVKYQHLVSNKYFIGGLKGIDIGKFKGDILHSDIFENCSDTLADLVHRYDLWLMCLINMLPCAKRSSARGHECRGLTRRLSWRGAKKEKQSDRPQTGHVGL